MSAPTPTRIILTPEQRVALGKVYQLILSWRRQRLQREAEASTLKKAQLTSAPVPVSSDSESDA